MHTVFVGLSGGVDSAVSAALLKEQGYNVVGCFIKIWQPEFIECTWREDRIDAIRVCAALRIPYQEIDLSQAYKDEVITDMVNNYKRGVTPNPDVLCNSKIKFGQFAEWAFSCGADFVATGHYARIEKHDGRSTLLRGVDTDKDQSYFLWQLREKDLDRVIFPVGNITKSAVRNEAARRMLPVARKKDSQGLCFVGDITLAEFLSHYVPLIPGDVFDMRGARIGRHEGAALYTRGQRHGFTHSGSEAMYVVSVDIESNSITVSPEKHLASQRQVQVTDTRWIHLPHFPLRSSVQIRYREQPHEAETTHEATIRVTFREPHIVASGQSLVWYEGDKVLGGGIVTV